MNKYPYDLLESGHFSLICQYWQIKNWYSHYFWMMEKVNLKILHSQFWWHSILGFFLHIIITNEEIRSTFTAWDQLDETASLFSLNPEKGERKLPCCTGVLGVKLHASSNCFILDERGKKKRVRRLLTMNILEQNKVPLHDQSLFCCFSPIFVAKIACITRTLTFKWFTGRKPFLSYLITCFSRLLEYVIK